jgi:restriction endonuclease S subunit
MTVAPVSLNSHAVVKISNVCKDGTLDMDDAQFHQYSEKLNHFTLHIGDIVVAMTGATLGKVAIVNKPDLLLNQRVGALRVKEMVLQNYLFNLLQTQKFYGFCQQKSGGGAQGNIAPNDILEYTIPLPPLETQRVIVAEIEAERALVEANRELIDRMEKKIKAVIERVWGREADVG